MLIIFLKYLFIGIIITLIVCILAAIIATISDWIDSKICQGFCLFIAVSAVIGYLVFLCTGNIHKDYRYTINYDGARYWTNDFTVSGGAITFFDQNGDGNTIKSGYTIKDNYNQIDNEEDK